MGKAAPRRAGRVHHVGEASGGERGRQRARGVRQPVLIHQREHRRLRTARGSRLGSADRCCTVLCLKIKILFLSSMNPSLMQNSPSACQHTHGSGWAVRIQD